MDLTANQIRIIIADDFSIFREGLISILSKQPWINIMAQASNGLELVQLVEQLKPDLVITDIDMPVMCGVKATSEISRRFPETGVIALSPYDKESLLDDILQAGAKAYLLKNADPYEVIIAIKKVHKKDTYYSSNTVSNLLSSKRQNESAMTEKPSFTEKEIKVIKLICQEYSSKEIASKLNSTTRSIESAKERIQRKTGAKNMMGTAIYAIKNGIVSLDG
jgi:DNA-binding NarL/FixJ family response regulator